MCSWGLHNVLSLGAFLGGKVIKGICKVLNLVKQMSAQVEIMDSSTNIQIQKTENKILTQRLNCFIFC